MTIPALPSLDRTSPTFKTDLDAFFLTELPATVTAMNAEITRIDGIVPAGFVGTSTTSLAITASGTVTLTAQTGKGFAAGQFVVISVTADPAVQMGGTVTAYDYTTGALSVSVSQSAGSGTYAAWTVAISAMSASPYSTGDIALTNRPLTAPTWLPADGAIYSQASYAALYAEVGLLPATTNTAATTTFPASQYWGAVAAQGTNAVAVGLSYTHPTYNGNTAATSSDSGATWTARTLPSTAGWKKVAFGGTGLVLASSSATELAYSTDSGVTWSARTSPISDPSFILYINNTWVLIPGSGTSYATSPDASVWTTRTLPFAPTNSWDVAVSQNGLAVLGPSSNNQWVLTSTDGITWTQRALPRAATYLTGVAVLPDGRLWVHGYMWTVMAESTDSGATWTEYALNNTSLTGATTQSVVTSAEVVWLLPASSSYFRQLIQNRFVFQRTTPASATVMSPAIAGNFILGTRAGAANTATGFRLARYDYDSATQFAVPNVTAPAPAGVTAYIKA